MKSRLNKKGFTLIELLAVIVILAVIALIAVPQIIKILNNARRSAAEDSAYGIIKTAESYVATYMMMNQGDWAGNVTFTCNNTGADKGCKSTSPVTNGVEDPSTGEPKTGTVTLEIKGTLPSGGQIKLDSEGKATIESALIINNFKCEHPTEDTEKTTIKCLKNNS